MTRAEKIELALREIVKCECRYRIDPLEHAREAVDHMRELAEAALALPPDAPADTTEVAKLRAERDDWHARYDALNETFRFITDKYAEAQRIRTEATQEEDALAKHAHGRQPEATQEGGRERGLRLIKYTVDRERGESMRMPDRVANQWLAAFDAEEAKR